MHKGLGRCGGLGSFVFSLGALFSDVGSVPSKAQKKIYDLRHPETLITLTDGRIREEEQDG